MTTVGIIGAGHIGSALAKGLADRGYDVVIANSRGPETLETLAAELGERVTAASAKDAAAAADWAIVTVPLKAIDDVPAGPLADKIVFDTNNYYVERDGSIAALDEKQTTTSELVQHHLADSHVVKAFNHIFAHQILTDGTPAGTPGRRALAIASDFPDASELATRVYDQFGYDTVDLGPLSESWRIERDTPAYTLQLDAEELRVKLAEAVR